MKLLTTFLFSLFWFVNVNACTCFEKPDDTLVSKTPVIFRGVVESILPDIFEFNIKGENGEVIKGHNAVLRITESWKGLHEQSTVKVSQLSGNCNMQFEVGQEYLLFCVKHGKKSVRTDGCMGTEVFDPNRSVLQKLGPGTRPPNSETGYGVIVIAAVIISTLGLIWKRKIKAYNNTSYEK